MLRTTSLLRQQTFHDSTGSLRYFVPFNEKQLRVDKKKRFNESSFASKLVFFRITNNQNIPL